MEEGIFEGQTTRPRKSRKLLIIAIIVIVFLIAGIVEALFLTASKKGVVSEDSRETSGDSMDTRGQAVELVDEGNFGFLIPGLEDDEISSAIKESGARWVRPHPGVFVWGKIQKGKADEIDFRDTDSLVKDANYAGLNLLITLWPYADWDQKTESSCKVSEDDQFAREIPLYRCPPKDKEAYKSWLKAIVERYDGDGENDMPDLQQPIKYWEISNEPDLDGENLKFFVGTSTEYAELLHYSYSIIRYTDPSSKVLIAGAAGVQREFQSFWEEVFAIDGINDAFDIANIHAINGGNFTDLNVSDYKKLLDKYHLSKPIWVTEAESHGGGSTSMNIAELEKLVGNALSSGAEKIFFTGSSLTGAKQKYDPMNLITEKDYYKNIIGKF